MDGQDLKSVSFVAVQDVEAKSVYTKEVLGKLPSFYSNSKG